MNGKRRVFVGKGYGKMQCSKFRCFPLVPEENRLTVDGAIVVGSLGFLDRSAYRDLIDYFAIESTEELHPLPSSPGIHLEELHVCTGLGTWRDANSKGWIATSLAKPFTCNFFSVAEWGSWRLAFLLAWLQRAVWCHDQWRHGVAIRQGVEAACQKLVNSGAAATISEARQLRLVYKASLAGRMLVDSGVVATLEEARQLKGRSRFEAVCQKLVDASEAATLSEARALVCEQGLKAACRKLAQSASQPSCCLAREDKSLKQPERKRAGGQASDRAEKLFRASDAKGHAHDNFLDACHEGVVEFLDSGLDYPSGQALEMASADGDDDVSLVRELLRPATLCASSAKPVLVHVIGLPGSGKTTILKTALEHLGCVQELNFSLLTQAGVKYSRSGCVAVLGNWGGHALDGMDKVSLAGSHDAKNFLGAASNLGIRLILCEGYRLMQKPFWDAMTRNTCPVLLKLEIPFDLARQRYTEREIRRNAAVMPMSKYKRAAVRLEQWAVTGGYENVSAETAVERICGLVTVKKEPISDNYVKKEINDDGRGPINASARNDRLAPSRPTRVWATLQAGSKTVHEELL